MNSLNAESDERKSGGAKAVLIFFDGAGCRPGGAGSGFAWCCPGTGEKHVERVDGLTNNQAEYHAFLSALQALRDGATAQLFTDSQVVCFQFNGEYKVKDPKLVELLLKAQQIIKEKQLKIAVSWVPREKNLAGKLL
jgi:ribonuclease HI